LNMIDDAFMFDVRVESGNHVCKDLLCSRLNLRLKPREGAFAER
jgi:hypothetical protein